MHTVKISPKYQVVIPKDVRNTMNLKPGQQIQILQYQDRIEMIPFKNIADMKGFLKGINTDFYREDDRL
ncbi:AbrB/MazE/SpoVT family DNA-binding domain-containing protein [bacterium]|nr:AbrB/MazE/SpoVT family DNA-binding domain-containing protein [bacterium]MBU1063208.1 AbrB/MazE/SpoVT family DNA-binding domain-containing protein [bacterium]MBU1635580.1 AbrB/MazE/SpoVT family DNA-binding domain-containing protein [bacterium]MBU1873738.1 AbrB/MazE/SpoVT family DNA-binding domain-containing protein [bacterium]MDO9547669.1 AbrB/MazE/SpoVT family DNA-binding domain-containing protein [Candidatus Neomarinimicrobiota bacterium]